jgi:hypothetical protein
LNQIESKGFSYSLLSWIEIPRIVRFVDGSAFLGRDSYSMSIGASHDQFVAENDFHIDIANHG